jgi:hypothetical protein
MQGNSIGKYSVFLSPITCSTGSGKRFPALYPWMGESDRSERFREWLDALPDHDFR